MRSISHHWRRSVRVAATVVCLGVLVRSIDISALGRLLTSATPRLLIPAIVVGALSQASAFPQWVVLIRDRSLLGWRSLASVFLRATFIGQALPTGVGGDAVRAVEVGRTVGYATALGSVIASHLMGLLAMGCWAVAGSVFVSGMPTGTARVLAGTFLVLATGIVFAALNSDRILRRCRGAHRGTRMLLEMGHSLASYRNERRRLLWAFLLCLGGWALSLGSLVLFADSVGANASWEIFALAVPVSLTATLIPITVNGFGIREGVFVGVLAHSGVGPVAAAALAVFADLQILPVALLGGAVCLGGMRLSRRPAPVPRVPASSPRPVREPAHSPAV